MSYQEDPLVDSYIEGFSEEIQHRLQKIRHAIQATFPHSIEAISYGMPTYRPAPKKRGLIHFAVSKNHIGLYGVFDPKNNSTIYEKMKPYRTGRGTLQFQHSEPLPMATIRQILAHHEGHVVDLGLYK